MKVIEQSEKTAFNLWLTSAALATGVGCVPTTSWAEVRLQPQADQEVGITRQELDSIEVLTDREPPENARREIERRDPELTQIDQDRNGGLVWSEIYAIYDDELDNANWTVDYVFAEYDENNDHVLNEEEYMDFLGGLKAQTAANVHAHPPPPSELDTTAGTIIRENELPGTVDAREEQMRI